jgi:hypothetical protein
VWKITLIASHKFVLVALADHACEFCGLTWPGISSLQRDTGLGERTIQEALKALAAAGHIRIRDYPHGGRGRATEYIVLPTTPGLSKAPFATATPWPPAPCDKCKFNRLRVR